MMILFDVLQVCKINLFIKKAHLLKAFI